MNIRETIADLSAQLDRDPGNQALRAALADLIDEYAESEDDVILAAAMRLLADRHRCPERWTHSGGWWGWYDTTLFGKHYFVGDLFGNEIVYGEWYDGHPTRAAAELLLGKALVAEGKLNLRFNP